MVCGSFAAFSPIASKLMVCGLCARETEVVAQTVRRAALTKNAFILNIRKATPAHDVYSSERRNEVGFHKVSLAHQVWNLDILPNANRSRYELLRLSGLRVL